MTIAPLVVEIAVALESPWRVGTGTSRSGAADDETWRSRGNDGPPVIPASHLKRRLRERAEWLCGTLGLPHCTGRLAAAPAPAAGLRGCQVPEESCVLCRLFGSPRVESGWRFHDAAPVEAIGTRLRAHNAIDPWARRAGEDLLFVLEAGIPTVTYARAVRLLGDDASGSCHEEVGLLVASVGALEAVGGRRNRGYGACRAWVLGAPAGRDHQAWVSALLAQAPVPNPGFGTPA